MGGNITVSSKLNQGTQFIVTLPFKQQDFNLTEMSEEKEKLTISLPQTKQKKGQTKNDNRIREDNCLSFFTILNSPFLRIPFQI